VNVIVPWRLARDRILSGVSTAERHMPLADRRRRPRQVERRPLGHDHLGRRDEAEDVGAARDRVDVVRDHELAVDATVTRP
jgi:hypothetical protein